MPTASTEHTYRYITLTTADGEPTALWLLQVEKELMENAISVPNDEAADAGWSKLILTDADYTAAFSNCTMQIPPVPGARPPEAPVGPFCAWERRRDSWNAMRKIVVSLLRDCETMSSRNSTFDMTFWSTATPGNFDKYRVSTPSSD